MPEQSSPLQLADMLRGLRQELERARENVKSSGGAPLLDLEGAEVEVKFTVAKEGSGKGGVNIHFFAVEIGGKYNSEEVHRLTLKLHRSKGADVSVAE